MALNFFRNHCACPFGSEVTQLVNVTTYDIAKYAERARKLTGDAEKLLASIDRLNLEAMVDI